MSTRLMSTGLMHETKRLLVVDDDPLIRGVLCDLLESENYHVSEARDGAETLSALAGQPFDLITLDLGLPGLSGVDLAREICLATDTPIIVVSARSGEYDRIVALELGADDYIVKPFSCRELVARVRAVLRRAGGQPRSRGQVPVVERNIVERNVVERNVAERNAVVFHNYSLNTQTRKLRANTGATTDLTSAECSLLEVLIANAGRACSRDEITSRMKGRAWSPLDRSLDTLVARVRRKIELDPHHPSLLMSVRGVGYMMTV